MSRGGGPLRWVDVGVYGDALAAQLAGAGITPEDLHVWHVRWPDITGDEVLSWARVTVTLGTVVAPMSRLIGWHAAGWTEAGACMWLREGHRDPIEASLWSGYGYEADEAWRAIGRGEEPWDIMDQVDAAFSTGDDGPDPDDPTTWNLWAMQGTESIGCADSMREALDDHP